MASEPRGPGASPLRIEDEALLTGAGCFVADIRAPGALAAAFVRSPHAHAAIRRIDVAAARRAPGVVAVYTLGDFRPHLASVRLPPSQPARELPPADAARVRAATAFVLAADEVRHVGEAVAMVVAEDRATAEDALGAVAVEYEPLPPVVDCADALAEGSPGSRIGGAGNLLVRFEVGYGDPDAAFADAAHVVGARLVTHRGAAHPLEGRGVLALPEPGGGPLRVWSSTQSPHGVRNALAGLLDVDEDEIRVTTPDVGGGFGAKYHVFPEEASVALAARLIGRPVRWIEDRREHCLAAIQEREQRWTVEAAFDRDARLLAVRGDMIHDQGAYAPHGVNVPYNAATGLPGPYRLPHYRMRVDVAETNLPPVMPVRGAGYPQGCFVMERLMDRAARQIGLDRLEIRRRNLIRPEEMPYATPLRTRAGTAIVYDSGDYVALQSAVVERIDRAGFERRRARSAASGRLRGLGFANSVKGTGRGPFETGAVRVGRSGRVTVTTGAAPMGQGIATALAQIAAEPFDLDPAAIRVVLGDTATSPLGHGGFASRQLVTAGSSVRLAAEAVRTRALTAAAAILRLPVEALSFRDGRVVADGGSNLSLSLAEIAREVSGAPGYSIPAGLEAGLEASANWIATSLAFAGASHAAEVEVDPGTGLVTLLRHVVAADCGRRINPRIVEGQIVGAVAHGIGNALFERVDYDADGNPQAVSFARYLLPIATDLPRIEVIVTESPSPLNPLGAKGAGEVGVVGATAAVVSAVEDALSHLGATIDRAPILPHHIAALIDAAAAPQPERLE